MFLELKQKTNACQILPALLCGYWCNKNATAKESFIALTLYAAHNIYDIIIEIGVV
jgi:hypothetical protein